MAAPPPPVSAAAITNMVKLVVGGGLAAYGVSNSLFNVEGGHRGMLVPYLHELLCCAKQGCLVCAGGSGTLLLFVRMSLCAALLQVWAERMCIHALEPSAACN